MRAIAFAAFVASCGGSTTPVASVEIPLPQSQPEGVYVIHFDRPSRVGERTRFLVNAEEDRITTTRRGRELVSDEHVKKRGHFDAIATVMALDPRMDAANVLFDITDLTYTVDARELVHRNHGKLEIERARKESNAKVMLDGAEASDDVREAAKLLLTLTIGGPSDDEVMGTPVVQRIGSHWRIDGKRAGEALAQEEGGEVLEGASVTGDAWLENVAKVSGIDCLDVHAIIHVDGLDIGTKLSAAVDVARVSAKLSTAIPIDPSLGRVSEHMTTEVTFKMRTPSPAGEITTEMEFASKRDAAYTPVSRREDASR